MSNPPRSNPNGSELDEAPDVARKLNQALAQGAFVNGLGTLAKASVPLIFLVLARLYGPALLGAYAITTATTRFLESMLTSGFRDAMVMYGARYAHRSEQEHQDRLYRAVGNALVFSLGLSVLALLIAVGIPWVLEQSFEDPLVRRALRIGLIALPFTNLRELALAMIRSQMVMRYDAFVNGVVGPLTLLVLVGIGGLISPRIEVLMALWVCSEILTCGVAVYKAKKHFDWGRAVRAALPPKRDDELLWFALPQNLNSTFTYFVTSLDVVMLGLYGVKTELVGFYSIASQILRDLRSPRRSFSAVLSPLVARLHHEDRLSELSYHFATTSRWILTVTIPMALGALLLLPDVLRLLHDTYTHDMGFTLLLAVNPLLAAAIGLAGNVLVMTGYSRINLINSVIAATLNVGLNVLLIPRLGIYGAALATMCGGVIVTILQILEAKHFVGLQTHWAALRKPMVAGAVALSPLAVGWLLGWRLDSTLLRGIHTALALGVYALAIWLQGIDPEDRTMISDVFLRRRKVVLGGEATG